MTVGSRNVYIVNSSGYKNYDKAEKYGNLVIITGGYITLTSDTLGPLYDKIKNTIALSSPQDFLVLSGPPLINIIVCQCWLWKHGLVHILSWNGNDYNEVTIDERYNN